MAARFRSRFLSVLLLLPLFCSLTVLSVAQAGAVQPSLAGAAKENYTVDTEPGFYKSPAYRNMLTMDRIEYDWLYKINMDFIKNGLAAYYKSGDKDYMPSVVSSAGVKTEDGRSTEYAPILRAMRFFE